ncbi:MAG TPA: penicillin acylase family protein [Trebonia sp.]
MLKRVRRGGGRARRVVNLVGAIVVSALLLGVLGFGYGAIPALGPALDPGRGAWTSAAGGQPVSSQRLQVPGVTAPVTVSFSAQGIASISAGNTHDTFLALGYVHAKFRLAEMDAERRLGEGRLAQLAGPSDLASDEFELRLGLLRTAQNEWARTTGAARAALLAYAQGVNDDIAQVRASGDWPALFTLSGQYPGPWTPVDSLVVQGVLTQELDYTTGPLDYALLQKSLGPANTADWFPTLAKNTQTPYDPGPYVKAPLTPVPPDVASSAPTGPAATTAASGPAPGSASPASSSVMSGDGVADISEISTSGGSEGPGGNGGAGGGTGSRPADSSAVTGAVTGAAASVLDQLSQLLPNQIHHYPDSNAWAANGPAVEGGGALLGGDPHLLQTLPSVWYEVALSAPGYQVAGVSVPGVPGILLGHNANIAWSLTDTQNSATFYYAEKTRGTRYYRDGAWQPMTVVHYSIPVRGQATRQLTVDITAQGPIISKAGQTMAVDWMGNVPSADVAALIGVNTAANFTQFKAALAGWHAPTQNFVYADTFGNIGVVAPGYYPQVPAGCQPWLPMPGTGACDIDGVIPYRAVPQAYDPPSHLIATDNQRPVSGDYPYYVGTALDFYDPGYRAAYAYSYLKAAEPLTPASIADLQNSVTDPLALRLLPAVTSALSGGGLSGQDQQAAALLRSWNGAMDSGSAAASLWSTFWGSYLNTVFAPWWQAGKVPVSKDRPDLSINAGIAPLDEDLESWTLGDQSNAAFAGPTGHGPSTADAAIVAAFKKAVAHLSAKLGGAPSTWTWGKIHSRSFPSLDGATGLGYGPRPAGGDPFTEDAADGGLNASTGPSWRMVVGLGNAVDAAPPLVPGTSAAFSPTGVYAVGVYPGGQSENPASPWYENLIDAWWNGEYLALPVPGQPAGPVAWRLDG